MSQTMKRDLAEHERRFAPECPCDHCVAIRRERAEGYSDGPLGRVFLKNEGKADPTDATHEEAYGEPVWRQALADAREITGQVSPYVAEALISSGRYRHKRDMGWAQADDIARGQFPKAPIATGLLAYFPDACAYVAHVSKVGNDQHNPGEALAWQREKSSDHENTLARHFTAGVQAVDTDGVLHAGKTAWRAMARLQLELERRRA